MRRFLPTTSTRKSVTIASANKPINGTQLDRRHPLVRDMVLLVAPLEKTGDLTYDSVGNTSLRLVNDPGRLPQYSGSINMITANQQYIDCGNDRLFQVPTGSLECWFDTTANGDAQFAAGIPFEDTGAWANPFVALQVGAFLDGLPRFWINVGGADIEFAATAGITFKPNQLNHMVLTYDGIIARGYLNGLAAGSNAVAGTIAYNGNPSFLIGNRNLQSPGQTLNGRFVKAALWRQRTLNFQEIRALYNRPWEMFESTVPYVIKILIPTSITINVFDTTTVTESVTLIERLSININDTITLNDDNPNIIRNNPAERTISVNSASSLTESVTLRITMRINVNDTITLSELPNVAFPPPVINVSDSSTLSEFVSVNNGSILFIDANDDIILDDFGDEITVNVITPPISPSREDTTMVVEYVNVELGQYSYHEITINAGLHAFSQYHVMRINSVQVQLYSNRNIQKPVGSVIRI